MVNRTFDKPIGTGRKKETASHSRGQGIPGASEADRSKKAAKLQKLAEKIKGSDQTDEREND